MLSNTRSAWARRSRRCRCLAADGEADDRVDTNLVNLARLAEHAAERHGRHINLVLIGVGGPSGFTRTFVRGEGAELFDESGRAYLDFVAGFGRSTWGTTTPMWSQRSLRP